MDNEVMKYNDEFSQITIDYLLEGENHFHRIILSYNEYMEEDALIQNYDNDIPRFDDPLNYIVEEHRKSTVYFNLCIKLHAVNKIEERIFRFYWNNQTCDLTLSQSFINDQLSANHVVYSNMEQVLPFAYEIARLGIEQNKLILDYVKDVNNEQEGLNGQSFGTTLETGNTIEYICEKSSLTT